MPEPGVGEYQRKQLSDEKESLRGFLGDWEDDIDQATYSAYGPTYKVVTSKNTQLTISTFIQDFPTYTVETSQRVINFLVQNSLGDIVARRKTNIFQKGEDVFASGKITVFQRDEGIATSLELAHLDFLAREADRVGKPVKYYVIDQNKQDLKSLQEKSQSWFAPSRRHAAYLPLKQVERKRWEELYGSTGKLGANSEGIIVVLPVVSPIPIVDIDHITLQRSDIVENGRKIMRGVVDIHPGDTQIIQKRCNSHYRNYIRPQISRQLQKK